MKVLTYESWNGQLNNVRMSFECAVVLAFLLRRKLVVSTRFSPTSSAWMAEILDLALLRRAVPLTCPTDRDYPDVLEEIERLPPGDTLEFDPYPKTPDKSRGQGPGTAILCSPGFPEEGTAEFERLRRFAAGRYGTRLPQNHESYSRIHLSPMLEHFYSFFFVPADVERECKQLVKDFVRYRPEIVAAAKEITGRLGAFAAMHVRRGDFLEARPRQCFAGSAMVEATRAFLPPGGRLYIATNETAPEFFDAFREHYEVVLFHDVAHIGARNMPSEWIAACEQLVCAEAQVFVGTMLSTFSGYVTRLRGYRNAEDQVFRFTDGTSDARGPTPDYSWRDTVRSRIALWGREYREAWAC